MGNKDVDKKLKEIEEKLIKNPDLRVEIKELVNRIEEIFDTAVEINIVSNQSVDEYLGLFNEYDTNELDYHAMSLGDFIDYISKEDKTLNLSIDPLYLKDGINEINNVILTTIDDKVVIVPMINKEEK